MSVRLQATASSLPRLFLCLASGLLKQTAYNTEYAEAGKERHGTIESGVVAGDLSSMPAKVRALVEGMTVRAEVSVVYDAATHTARELGAQLGRSYGTLKPFEIPGTIDLLAVGDGRVVIADWKGYEAVDGAERNRQILLYALAVALIYRVFEVTVAIAYLSDEDRAIEVVTLEMPELDVYADELKALQLSAAKASTNPHAYEVVGRHCKYCPAFLDCDKQKQLEADFKANVIASKFNSVIPFENDQDAADAFDLFERMQLFIQRVRSAIYARAAERPIPLNNGKMLGEREKLGGREIDGDAAYALIREKYGQEVADKAVRREAAQTWIKAALTGHKDVKSAEKAKDELVELLDKAGKVKRKKSVAIEQYDTPLARLKASNE